MTIPITNVNLTADIQAEFAQGGATPTALSEYYRGGTYVPSGQGDAGYGLISSAGTIAMGPFRNQTYNPNFVFNDVITSTPGANGGNSTTPYLNYNLRSRALAAGWSGTVPLIATITVNANAYITSSSTATPAFTLGTMVAGSTVSLINNGTIAGKGGAGGTGGSFNGAAGPYSPSNSSGYTQGGAGGNGGVGLHANYAMTITNGSSPAGIGGGGGGGCGAGASYVVDGAGKGVDWGSGGSGGGGGRVTGAGGAFGGCNMNGAGFGQNGAAGNAATNLAAGTGGTITLPLGYGTRSGGAGGNLGQPGSPGDHGDINVDAATWGSSGGAGGAAGNAVTGGANITWNAFGTRAGAIDNPGINNTGGAINNHANQTLSHACAAVGCNSSVWVNFYTDGDERGFAQGNVLQFNTSWYTPDPTPGIGASYWVRADVLSGTNPNTGNVLGTWLQLNSVRSWGLSSNSGFRSTNLRVRIASDSAGSNVEFDVTYFMDVEGGGF